MSNRTLTLLMGFVAFLILVVGVVFIVVAVGGGDDEEPASADGNGDEQDNGDGGDEGDDEETPDDSGDGANNPEICEGDALIVPGDEPQTVFDPIQVGDVSTSEYVVEIFGGLVTLDPQLQVQPDIAERWEVSEDGLTYTFFLRQNVLFHNERRVVADDVKYSIERAADPENASPTVLAYLGRIEGVEAKFNGEADEVSGVRVVDESTVEIKLTQREEYFLSELAYPVAYVVDQEQIENDPRNWTRRPNGTGPYQLAEFSPAERIRLVANDRYHLGAPNVDEVVFELGGGSITTRYENDELHIGFVPLANLEDVKEGNSPLSEDYRSVPELATFYITLNSQQPPFDDPKVRQALALALDRAGINEVLLYGAYRVADGFLPPEMPGYDEAVTSYEYDVARAQQMLSESQYSDNMPRIVLNYAGTGGNSPEILVAIQEGWRDALGIEVELQAVDSAAFLREQRRGTFQMLSDGWSADYPDPEDFIGKLFASDSQLNYTKYSNPEVDRLIDEAAAETDTETRYDLYTEAEQIIMDDAIVLPTFWSVEHTLVKQCVKDFPDVSMTVPKYRFASLEP